MLRGLGLTGDGLTRMLESRRGLRLGTTTKGGAERRWAAHAHWAARKGASCPARTTRPPFLYGVVCAVPGCSSVPAQSITTVAPSSGRARRHRPSCCG